MIDPVLLDLLVCPVCKGNLIWKEEQQELVCLESKLAYPVRDGLPVMLESEARKLGEQESV
ncbi:Trm112 family protein [Agaribacterium sp. ZY112]|uniref:Trm112 family protein n=1 Tax=Agaribacterium sp. ZY112 TaxID=3233574 RepID=UPI0035258B4B